MDIRKIKENKKKYLDFLLLADEQEEMIDRYLERGTLYVLEDKFPREAGGTVTKTCAVCVVTDEGEGILEIKNLAVSPKMQKRGWGRYMIQFVEETYRDQFEILQVGTGDSPATVPFYEKCGFHRSHVVRNFFTDHYDHPIYECGRQLVDMVYLRKELHDDSSAIKFNNVFRQNESGSGADRPLRFLRILSRKCY